MLSNAEIATIWHALDGRIGMALDVAEALRLLLLTGQRPGETQVFVRTRWLKPTLHRMLAWSLRLRG